MESIHTGHQKTVLSEKCAQMHRFPLNIPFAQFRGDTGQHIAAYQYIYPI